MTEGYKLYRALLILVLLALTQPGQNMYLVEELMAGGDLEELSMNTPGGAPSLASARLILQVRKSLQKERK